MSFVATATCMKASNDHERDTMRTILARTTIITKDKWNECPCGWFYLGPMCPDQKCDASTKPILTTLYAHVDDGDEFNKGRELGLSQKAAETFSGWGYELEFEAEVNPKTGEVKLLSVDGHKIQY